MPCLSVGEKVPEVTSPTAAPCSDTVQWARGMPRPVTSRPRMSRVGSARSNSRARLAPEGDGFFQPTAQPARACTGVISSDRS